MRADDRRATAPSSDTAVSFTLTREVRGRRAGSGARDRWARARPTLSYDALFCQAVRRRRCAAHPALNAVIDDTDERSCCSTKSTSGSPCSVPGSASWCRSYARRERRFARRGRGDGSARWSSRRARARLTTATTSSAATATITNLGAYGDRRFHTDAQSAAVEHPRHRPHRRAAGGARTGSLGGGHDRACSP